MVRLRYFTFAAIVIFGITHGQVAWGNASRNRFVGQGEAQRGYIVQVGEGLGLNISFVQTGEQIDRVWLDDLSEIVLDLDRPLPRARIIHLKRIEKLEVPYQVRAPGRSTLLTVITNEGNIYKFIIQLISGVADHQSIHILPERDPVLEIDSQTRARLVHVERGLAIAIQDKRLPPESPLVPKVREFVIAVRRGQPPAKAAQDQGLLLSFIYELARLGLRPIRPILPR